MAFYCNHMAIHLVRGNSNFEIYSPIIMNAELIVYKSDFENIHTLGISQKRDHLKKLAIETNPNIEDISEISPPSLPYALEKDLVDAIVLDVSKAGLLEQYDFKPLSEHSYISYSLVVRKDIVGTPRFEDFISNYNESVKKLNKNDYLKDILDIDFLEDINILFLELE